MEGETDKRHNWSESFVHSLDTVILISIITTTGGERGGIRVRRKKEKAGKVVWDQKWTESGS